ncbi:nucleotide-binding protein [Imhoffiella purpurea]|uniref:CobQ/CobB/MinD/ParA nucleotide binding domain-containing protein n=1 Tax=Imhoffiella purpurea TaxID=1249627 RepID=W9V9A2_9GAMM|nr:hypothetical protein [Imhoffiella purpurea]EXJ12657.1 hypothetical protein D779_4025 [Imhoffiella purpurea]
MHTVWVMNGKGGVGKSVLMMALAWLYEAMQRPLRLIDVDDKSKLSEFVGEDNVLSLRIGADAEALRADPSQAYSYWDQLAAEILEQDTAVDFGANMDRHILDWARKSELGDLLTESGVTMDIFVPVTADPVAVLAGIQVLEAAAEVFPQSRRILVLNQIAGSFNAYESTREFERIATMRSEGLLVVGLDSCMSEAWIDFERLKLPPWRIIEMNAATVAQQTGLGILAAKRAVGDYASWLKHFQQSFAPLVATRVD